MEAGQPPITIAIPSQTVTEVIKLKRDATVNDVPSCKPAPCKPLTSISPQFRYPKPGDLDQAGLNTYAKGLATQAGVDVT